MTNSGSLRQSIKEPQSDATVPSKLRNIEENGPQLLELRTDAGAVYVCPSRWQRVRLQWTFRHFHVLPPQLLSRRDQQLIEKLSRSAVVTPALPVASDTIFGVVEKPRSKAPASPNRVVTLRTELKATQVFLAKAEIADMPSPDLAVGVKQRATREAADGEVPFQQWGALGALAAVGLIVILASGYGIPLFSTAGQVSNPRTRIEHAANDVKTPFLHPATSSLLAAPAALAIPEKPKRSVAASLPEITPVHQEPAPLADGSGQFLASKTDSSASGSPLPAIDTVPDANPVAIPIVPSVASERRFVSELPQGHFAHPVVSEPNLVGELKLKALIGADGSVKEVTVLSGNPKLAEAGMRAVRQWHYSPTQVLGSSAEVETHIKMSFFGQDAVSIAAVDK